MIRDMAEGGIDVLKCKRHVFFWNNCESDLPSFSMCG